MTLPASGQISFNDLRVELGIPTQAPFSITTAATNGYVTINTNSPSYPNSATQTVATLPVQPDVPFIFQDV